MLSFTIDQIEEKEEGSDMFISSGVKKSVFLLFAALVAGCGKQSGTDTTTVEISVANVPKYSAEAFFATTSYGLAGGLAYSPDNSRLLIHSDESGVFNVYALPVDGGDAVTLTESDSDAMFAVSWFPDDERILFTFDNGGNELNHVVVRELDGSFRDLTPGDNIKSDFAGWSSDRQSFYLTSNERDPASFDLYRYAADNYERELIFENPGFGLGAISGDGRWLALDKPRTSADSDIYVVDISSDDKEAILITEHDGNIAYGVYDIAPDNRTLVYATDEHGEFGQAWSFDLETGEKRVLVDDDWDVSYVSFSASGTFRVVGVNADARTEVTITEIESGETITIPDLPQGGLSSIRFSADESKLALIVNADNSPSNIHAIDIETSSAVQLTSALNPEIDPAHLVVSKVIRYSSFDGLEIPSILYKPHGASAENPVPALVLVHGGPGGQTRTGYRAFVQHLVNQGYAVLGANNRGSSGYGKTFYHLDDRRHGEEDLLDIVYGRTYLESLDWVDSEKIGIIGGSYGGYMVAAALAFQPDVFDVGIDIFGVTNWERTLQSIPPWWEAFKEALYDEMGDPETDAERHHKISPLFHADQIIKPLLVIQGANDPRVLQVESDELVAAVKENEVPVEYVVFPDEGHGFRNKENRIAASKAYAKFLDTHLKASQE
jgi:dipeptidyl aminopeptidase/acylaminoacyl peptidase